MVPLLMLPRDFLPRQKAGADPANHLPWLIRVVEVVRGSMPIRVECAPAFNYARDSHTTDIVNDNTAPNGVQRQKGLFTSKNLTLDLRWTAGTTLENVECPEIALKSIDLSSRGLLGPAIAATTTMHEGQAIAFVLRHLPKEKEGGSGKQTSNVLSQDGEHVISRKANDPLLTQGLINLLLLVSSLPISSPHSLTAFFRLPISFGMIGFEGRHTMVHGKKLFIAVPSR